MFVKTTISVFGKRIRLTEERWEHVQERHPELKGRLSQVLKTVSDPDVVTFGWKDESVALREFLGQDIAVVYKDKNNGFIITAFLTRSRKYFEKRGIKWSKQN